MSVVDTPRAASRCSSLVTLGCYPVPERDKRLARNEALFREMNERVEERVQPSAGREATFAILCECADLDCVERILLTPAEYEAAHADPAQFTVVPGHAAVDVETIVRRNERFEVVRKVGLAGEIAEDLDT
jgi:hypothetical protein